MRLGWLVGLFIVAVPVLAAEDFYQEEIRKRISPIGNVRVQEAPAEARKAVEELQPEAQPVAEKAPGAEIYNTYCSVCHQAGVAGAPKFRAAEDWKARLSEKGISGLVTTAIKGINAMPPKGTCTKCTEEEIKQAVEYMVPQA
ncbi:c-type cytochrome [Legionella impletisoli]|uniref:Cytochrome c n=1 Tax=Legionella impletisoli TaxID=343510 RepID=A0A917NCQ0_9GAMM|nr:c-type cytochrome [Legionella impletisoli]GGI89151.1 cytochrome c [Legionella impletisoli]